MKERFVVVGAGAFGGWTALRLLERGADVTLVDAWGPAHSRASSGDESRVVRANHGEDTSYTRLAIRSLALWAEYEARWQADLLCRCGFLWLECHTGTVGAAQKVSLPIIEEAGLEPELLSAEVAGRRFPQIAMDGVQWAVYEPNAGYAYARLACQAVLTKFVEGGGTFVQAWAKTGEKTNYLVWSGAEAVPEAATTRLGSVDLSNGERLKADGFVFACGPWLRKTLRGKVGALVQPTRQEVFYLAEPPGAAEFSDSVMPAWVVHDEPIYYGVPGNEGRGFKVGDHTPGPVCDPDRMERVPTAEKIAAAQAFAGRRFPALRGAPVLESRVCQYEMTADGGFILDRHPRLDNVWIAAGGSGHGFKHGPVIGERMAALILDGATTDRELSVARLLDA